MNRPFLRALVAFLALPGVVAFVVPLLVSSPRGLRSFVNPIGLLPLIPGVGLLFWCVREFYVVGRGTLAPWSPPTTLVMTGPYQWSRNPMYVAVLLILCGWTLGFRSWALVVYTAAVAVAFHLRVRLYEEPWLERTFRERWTGYRARVPRWGPSEGHRAEGRGQRAEVKGRGERGSQSSEGKSEVRGQKEVNDAHRQD